MKTSIFFHGKILQVFWLWTGNSVKTPVIQTCEKNSQRHKELKCMTVFWVVQSWGLGVSVASVTLLCKRSSCLMIFSNLAKYDAP